MDDDLIQRLLFADREFPAALKGGIQMLSTFNQVWSSLPQMLHVASKTGSVSSETSQLVHSVASRVANIASCFIDIKRSEKVSATQLQSDWDAMIRQMAALDLGDKNTKSSSQPDSTNDPLSPPLYSSTSVPNLGSSSPAFLAPAYRWLLDNLDNPYPPAEVKTRIAATSSCQISSVNSWFANARRRIGWTTLCRERFSNCRADMIDAAYRALVEEDPERALSPELRHALVTVKVAAEDLYSSTFARTAFAEDLDTILRDVKRKDDESGEVGHRHQAKPTNFTKVREFENRTRSRVTEQKLQLQAPRDSYPSPDRSITTSPIPAINESFINESEEDAASPILAGSKRRRSPIDAVDRSSSPKSVKRLRASTSSATHLPSPPSSTNGFDISSDGDSSTLSPGDPIQPDTSSSRKRRLSDADDTINMPKCPCGSIAALHTVSDPLPRFDTEDEQSFDDWFNTNSDALFNIPPPVDATELDSSSSWQVELFKDYNIPPADTQLSVPYDLSDFDNLLQSIGSDTFVTPSGGVPPSDTNIDWSSFLNDPDVYQPTVYPTFPQYPADPQTPLPEIDLPMLQLPPIAPAVDSQEDLASKQAKLDQLHAMQEAVRRMEQELQSEGIL